MHEDLNMNDMPRGSSAISGFLLGAAVGAGLALLLAPAPGVETRRRIGDAARRLKDNTRERLSQARTTLGEIREDARAAVDTGREAFVRGRQSHQRPGMENTPGYSETGTEARPA